MSSPQAGESSAEIARLLQRVAELERQQLRHAETEAALRTSEEALGETHRRFQQVASTLHDVLWLTDWIDHRVIYVSEAYETLWGRSREALYANPIDWVAAIHPDDRDRVERSFIEDAANGDFNAEYRVVRPDGSVRWIRDRGYPIRDDAGRVYRIAGIAVDITEQKAARDRQRLLTQELDHRVKNNLAIVRAVAEQTMAASPSIDVFAEAFFARLQALAVVHEALALRHWKGAELRVLLERLLEPHRRGAGERIALEGLEVMLSAPEAATLCMILNELATNAAKFGSLTSPEGRLDVGWSIERTDDGAPELQLVWTERGGPPVEPPERRGFGTTLIERMTAYELDGSADIRFEPAGLTCTIRAPLRSSRDP